MNGCGPVAKRESLDTSSSQELRNPRPEAAASPHDRMDASEMASRALRVTSVRHLDSLLGDIAPLDRDRDGLIREPDRFALGQGIAQHISDLTRQPSRDEMPRQVRAILGWRDSEEEVDRATWGHATRSCPKRGQQALHGRELEHVNGSEQPSDRLPRAIRERCRYVNGHDGNVGLPLVDQVQSLLASCAERQPLDRPRIEPDRATHHDRGAPGSTMLYAANGVEQGSAGVEPPGCGIPEPAVQLVEEPGDPHARTPLLVLVKEDADPAALENVRKPDEPIVLDADPRRQPGEEARDPQAEDLAVSKVQAAIDSIEILGPELHLDVERLRAFIKEFGADQRRLTFPCDGRELVERGSQLSTRLRRPLRHPARPDRDGGTAATAPNAAADLFVGGGPNPSPKSARHFSRLESSLGSS